MLLSENTPHHPMNMIPALVQKTMSCLLIVKVSSIILRNIEYIENIYFV